MPLSSQLVEPIPVGIVLAMAMIDVLPEPEKLFIPKESINAIYYVIIAATVLVVAFTIAAFIRGSKKKSHYISLQSVTSFENASADYCITCTVRRCY